MTTSTTLPTPDTDVWGPEHDQPIDLILTRTTNLLLDFHERQTTKAASGHKVVTAERQGGYMALCDDGEVAFGSFPSRSDARAALREHAVETAVAS